MSPSGRAQLSSASTQRISTAALRVVGGAGNPTVTPFALEAASLVLDSSAGAFTFGPDTLVLTAGNPILPFAGGTQLKSVRMASGGTLQMPGSVAVILAD